MGALSLRYYGGRATVVRLLLASSSAAALLAGGGTPAAACYTGSFTGGYTNNGATPCIVVNNTSFSGNLVNSSTGTISPGNTPLNGSGIGVYNSTITGQISNAGTISVSGYGIWITSNAVVTNGIVNGSTSNTGTISAGVDGILVLNVSSFSGGIINRGTISATARSGIGVLFSPTFLGGMTNSGTITAPTGMVVSEDIHLFSGGMTNSGTISAGDYGIVIGPVTTFSGGITNSGTISSSVDGFYVIQVSTFSGGGISNTGTVTGNVGILAMYSGAVSVFDSGTIVGTGGTAVDLTDNAAGNTFTLGPGYSISGLVKGQGGDTFQLGGSGAGTFVLSNIGTQYTGFTGFNVVSGVWNTTGVFGQSQAWNVNGGTLAGTGTFQAVNVNAGGTLAPGTPSVAGTAMTINGSLIFASAAAYLDTISGANASKTAVNGTVTLGGASVQIASGSAVTAGVRYTILTDTGGGLGGGNIFNPNVSYGGQALTLSYDADDVYLTLSNLLGLLPPGAPANDVAVANAIDNYIAGGGPLPGGFSNLFNLSGAQLEAALTRLDGEDATGAQIGAFTLMTEFLELLSGDGGGGSGGNTGGGLGFATNQQSELPPDIALAYDAILKAPPKQTLDQRWSAWAAGFGGTSITDGNAAVGSNTVTTTTYGSAAGMEYRPDPNTRLGFALAGAGLNWGLAQGLGTGRSDTFQAGLYGKSYFGSAYFSGALAFGNNWFTTNRTAAFGDQLTASFNGQSYAARGEAGYRYAVPMSGALIGVTPYAALQTQWFHTPAYSETDLSGGGFALAYNANTANDTRSELGARFDDLTTWNNAPLMLRASLAWAHDWTSGTGLNAAFETLPGSNFTVNGAAVPRDSALTSASAQYFFTPVLSFTAKFDGEFAPTSQTYAGTGTLRYTW